MATVETLSPQAVHQLPAPSSGANLVNPVDGPFIRFPPFPPTPSGVRITPFKNFEETGIRVDPGPDDAEVDMFGIPTIPINVVHKNTDECKTNTKRKRLAEERKMKGSNGATKREWWEVWEDAEKIRFSTGFNPSSPRFERLQAATIDFTRDHTWPQTTAKETGPKFIWEKFLRYIGVPEGFTPIAEQSRSKKAKREEKEAEDDDMSDEEADGDEGDGIIMDRDAPALVQASKTASSNEEKLSLFLDDPEKAIKIFMTYHAWSKGFVWSEVNVKVLPRVLGFFVGYLLRSRVLPESERELRRSLEIISKAQVELPHTESVMKYFPEEVFAVGCTGCWGAKKEGYKMLFDILPQAAFNMPPAATEDSPDEPEAKKQKVDPVASAGWGNGNGSGGDSNGWGGGENQGWGDSLAQDAEANGWATATIISDEIEAWAREEPEKQPLLRFFGPSAFPLTHAPGIVERSMRRIKSVLPPNPNPPKSPPSAEYGPDATAVEVDLDQYFTKIVLVPMIDWDGGYAPVFTRPTILESSKGPVVTVGSSAETVAAVTEGSGPKPHDPLNDEITVLIESRIAASLHEGMGVAGTYVQLVRQGEPAKKKKKGKSKKPTVFWYLEVADYVMPSFWTAP